MLYIERELRESYIKKKEKSTSESSFIQREREKNHTHTHTHTHRERERERERKRTREREQRESTEGWLELFHKKTERLVFERACETACVCVCVMRLCEVLICERLSI